MDPGLRFWLRYVAHGGGLAEPTGDGTLVMLPEPLADDFDLPTELVVTSDPDVAGEDGSVLLTTGHPVLISAADATLTDGDTGCSPSPNRSLRPRWPTSSRSAPATSSPSTTA